MTTTDLCGRRVLARRVADTALRVGSTWEPDPTDLDGLADDLLDLLGLDPEDKSILMPSDDCTVRLDPDQEDNPKEHHTIVAARSDDGLDWRDGWEVVVSLHDLLVGQRA